MKMLLVAHLALAGLIMLGAFVIRGWKSGAAARQFALLAGIGLTAAILAEFGAVRVMALIGSRAPARGAAPAAREAMLSDFETPWEGVVRWTSDHSVIKQAIEHATHGRYAAAVTFYPAENSRISMDRALLFDWRHRNWSRFASLAFDLYNAQPDQERLMVQLRDAHRALYKEELMVPGQSSQPVSIRIANAATAIDVRNVIELTLFRWDAKAQATFYLDNVRLLPAAPGETPLAAASAKPAASETSAKSAAAPAPKQDAWSVGWATSLDKIRRDQPPASALAGPMRISLAKNETEAAQIVLIGAGASATLSVDVSPLSPEGGGAALPPEAVSLFQVGYVATRKPSYPVSYVGDWPDPLLPFTGSLELAARATQPLWLSVRTTEQTPPGAYSATVTIRDGGGRAERLPLEVRVWNVTLPRASRLKTAFDLDIPRLDQAYQTYVPQGTSWNDRLPELHRRYVLAMLEHRISPILEENPSDRQFAWDIKTYLDAGLTAFGVGSIGGNHGNKWPADPVELEQAMVEFRQAQVELAFLRLLDQAYVYAYDEPAPGDPQVAQVLRALRDTAPALRRMVAMHEAPDPAANAEWLRDLDILCVRLPAINPDWVPKYRELGKELWIYVSSPAHPTPNLVIDYPAISHRIIPWMAWKYGATGLLYWSVNHWNGDPMTNPASFQDDQNGNGFLLYPAADGPRSSIRLETLRDGIEDYDYFALLRAAIEQGKTRGADAALLAQAEPLLRVDAPIAASAREYTPDPAPLLQRREAIAAMIEKLQ